MRRPCLRAFARRRISALPASIVVIAHVPARSQRAGQSVFHREKNPGRKSWRNSRSNTICTARSGISTLQYMWKVAHGNLSISTQYRNRTVNEIIAQTLPVSMTLGSLAYSWPCSSASPRRLGGGPAQQGGRPVSHARRAARHLHPDFRSRAGAGHDLRPQAQSAARRTAGVRPTRLSCPRSASRFPSPPPSRDSPAAACWRSSSSISSAPPAPRACPEDAVLFRHALKVAILPIIGYSGPAAAGILTGPSSSKRFSAFRASARFSSTARSTSIRS